MTPYIKRRRRKGEKIYLLNSSSLDCFDVFGCISLMIIRYDRPPLLSQAPMDRLTMISLAIVINVIRIIILSL
jgi:hypothetical protein